MINIKKILIIILILIIDISAIFFAVGLFAKYIVKNKIETVISRYKGTVDITYQDIDVDLFQMGLRPPKLKAFVKNVKITPTGKKDGIKIDSITIYDINKPLGNLHLTANGVNLKVTEQIFSDITPYLTGLGFNYLRGNIDLDYNYDEGKKELKLNKLTVNIDRICSLELKLLIGNFPEDTIFDLPSFSSDFPDMLLGSGEISITDHSFFNSLLQLHSKNNNIALESEIVKINALIDEKFSIAEPADNLSKNTVSVLKKFIFSPNKISFKIKPKNPVTFGLIQEVGYSKLPQMLNLEAAATEKLAVKSNETAKPFETVKPAVTSKPLKTSKQANTKKLVK